MNEDIRSLDAMDLNPDVPEERIELAKRALACLNHIRKLHGLYDLYNLELYLRILENDR